MEHSKSIVTVSSPSEALAPPPSEAEAQLSNLVFDLSQQVQGAMENMLKMTNEIGQSSAAILEEIDKTKESAVERKKLLEEEKERFQKAAYTVLDLFNRVIS